MFCGNSWFPSVQHSTYTFRHWGWRSGSGGGGRRHNWATRPLHFPCKSASHSQSFHSSSRKHALSQPHSLNADETMARQLSPPTTMAGGRTSSARFADSCKTLQSPFRMAPGETFQFVCAREVHVRKLQPLRATNVRKSTTPAIAAAAVEEKWNKKCLFVRSFIRCLIQQPLQQSPRIPLRFASAIYSTASFFFLFSFFSRECPKQKLWTCSRETGPKHPEEPFCLTFYSAPLFLKSSSWKYLANTGEKEKKKTLRKEKQQVVLEPPTSHLLWYYLLLLSTHYVRWYDFYSSVWSSLWLLFFFYSLPLFPSSLLFVC